MRIQAVGGWDRYRCEARPSKASRPCSSSKVPSGKPTCACLVTRPFDSGNIAPSLPLGGSPHRALLWALAGLASLLLPLAVVRPPDLVAIPSPHVPLSSLF